MFTSRGCPYRCVFCASSRFWASTRFASAHYIAEEIKELYYNYGAKLISFYDDLFIVQKQRLKDLTDILSKEGILGKVRFSCSARSNLIDDVVAKLLKELGIVSVALGLESGHPCILRNFNVYVMTPFPGTPVWSEAVERGLISKCFDNWSVLDAVHFAKHYKKAIVLSRSLSREQLYRIYKKFQLLRYWTFFKNARHHPFVKDVPKMFWNLTKEKIAGLIRT